MYWRVVSVMDFVLAALNLTLAIWKHNRVSLLNLAAAVICVGLGAYAWHLESRRRANLAEEARIQHIRDNWRWN